MVKLTDNDLIVLFIRWWIGDATIDDLAMANDISYGQLNNIFRGRSRLNIRRKALEIVIERDLKYQPIDRRKERN
jgi:hypothetical protein